MFLSPNPQWRVGDVQPDACGGNHAPEWIALRSPLAHARTGFGFHEPEPPGATLGPAT